MAQPVEEFSANSRQPAPNSPGAAGDVFFDDVFITTTSGAQLDIKNFCTQIVLFEDMFSNVLTGTISVTDANNLISKAPLVGGEFLSIQLRTPGFAKNSAEVIRKTFVIYGISDRLLDADRQQFYTINFISVEGMQDNVNLLSKSFQGSTDKLVSDIYTQYLKTPRWYEKGAFTGEQTELIVSGGPHASSLRFVAPYWSPFKTINWLAHRSIGKTNKGPNFLFFETNKSFYFASIEDLIETQRNKGVLFSEYFYGTANVRLDSPGYSYSRPNLGRQYQIVQRQRFPEYFNLIKEQNTGYLASTLYTHDIVLKQYKEWIWDYSANFDSFQHLESYAAQNGTISNNKKHKSLFHSAVARNPVGYRSLRTKQFKMFNDYADPQYQNWVTQRTSLLNEVSNMVLELDVAGRTDVEVGMLIYYHYPNPTDKSFGDKHAEDPLLAGLFLITAIRHTFVPGKHEMRLEVVKDSFKQSVG